MWLRGAIVALIVATLAGCSSIKIAYNRADFIAAWMADDFFELTGEQKDVFREHFDRFHAWHRSTQLNEYAAMLAQVRERLNAGFKEADVVWTIESAKAHYRAIVARGHADAARVLSTLTDRQLDAARREFDKRNRKYAREWGIGASTDEQQRLRAKYNVERVEHWTGSLSGAQEARVIALSRALPLITDLRYQDRMRRQQEFLALLEGRKNLETFVPRLRDWLADWDRTRTPEYEAALTRFVEASAKTYMEVYAMLTPEQRAHVADRLQRYIAAFRELAQEAQRSALQSSVEGARDVRILSQ
jgi:hypothetical protein